EPAGAERSGARRGPPRDERSRRSVSDPAGSSAMTALIWVVVALMLVGTVLAMAESSLSRMTKGRALALQSEGRRNAAFLVKLETDPPRYLNAVYLAVMFVQNGSAILVAIIAEQYFGNLGVTLASIGFTVVYFVVVEAMAKKFGILHTDNAALAATP